MEFIKSLVEDGQMVSYKGYLYRKDKTNKATINWRCSVKSCKGRLTTTINANNDDVPTRVSGEHFHAPDPARIEVKKVNARVTEKAVNTHKPLRRIIADEIQPLNQKAASQLRSNRNLAVMINRKRKQVRWVPVAPNSRNGFTISEEYAKTPDGENFLLYDSREQDENRILIFGTKMMVDLLSCYHHWFVDGTFSVTPNIFYQVFTVHVLVNDTIIPCLYGFLPNKSKQSYERFWSGVYSFIQNLQPESILTNFELASIQPIQQRFPEATISSCFFSSRPILVATHTSFRALSFLRKQ